MISFSILIPTCNRAGKLRRLLRTLESEAARLKPDSRIQLLVSDNASSDETPAVVSDFSNNTFALKYFRQAQNLGFDGNVKFLYEIAETDYVWFLPDDDIPLPGSLCAILDALETHRPDILLFSFTQPPGNPHKTFDLQDPVTIITDPKKIIEYVYVWTKLSIYVLRKISFSISELKELESFFGNGYFFVDLSFSVLNASNSPRLCIISEPLCTCDEDYLYCSPDPNIFLYFYKVFYHPFVKKHAPSLPAQLIDNCYYGLIHFLYQVKTGAIIPDDLKKYDMAIKKLKYKLSALSRNPRVLLKLFLLKINSAHIYKGLEPIVYIVERVISKIKRIIRLCIRNLSQQKNI